MSISKTIFVISSFYLNVASMTLDADMLHFLINPFTLRVALYKAGLNIMGIFYSQKHFQGNISKRNVDQKPYNSPSVFL